jgi:hypothetical protein
MKSDDYIIELDNSKYNLLYHLYSNTDNNVFNLYMDLLSKFVYINKETIIKPDNNSNNTLLSQNDSETNMVVEKTIEDTCLSYNKKQIIVALALINDILYNKTMNGTSFIKNVLFPTLDMSNIKETIEGGLKMGNKDELYTIINVIIEMVIEPVKNKLPINNKSNEKEYKQLAQKRKTPTENNKNNSSPVQKRRNLTKKRNKSDDEKEPPSVPIVERSVIDKNVLMNDKEFDEKTQPLPTVKKPKDSKSDGEKNVSMIGIEFDEKTQPLPIIQKQTIQKPIVERSDDEKMPESKKISSHFKRPPTARYNPIPSYPIYGGKQTRSSKSKSIPKNKTRKGGLKEKQPARPPKSKKKSFPRTLHKVNKFLKHNTRHRK